MKVTLQFINDSIVVGNYSSDAKLYDLMLTTTADDNVDKSIREAAWYKLNEIIGDSEPFNPFGETMKQLKAELRESQTY